MPWSVEDIDGRLPRYMRESFATYYIPAGIMLGSMTFSLSYPVLHKMCAAKSKVYREELSKDQQLIVLQHIVDEASLLSALSIPYAYVVFSIDFEERPIEQLAEIVEVVAIFMVTLITMYLMELALRIANRRPLVLAHRLRAFFHNAILTTFRLDTAKIKAAPISNHFISYGAFTHPTYNHAWNGCLWTSVRDCGCPVGIAETCDCLTGCPSALFDIVVNVLAVEVLDDSLQTTVTQGAGAS